TVRITNGGAFTGALTLGTKRIAMRGRFTSAGAFTGIISGTDGQLDSFTLSLDPQSGEGTGSLLLDGDERATVRLVQARVWSVSSPFPQRGAFTMLLSPNAEDATAPKGIGFGRAVVNDAGRVRFAGALPDGSVLSHGVQLSRNADWP